MKKTELHPADDRVLQVMKWAVNSGTVRTEGQFLESIGMRRQNIHNVRNGNQGFRKEHFQALGEKYMINLNWVFGLEKNMVRGVESSPIERLKIIVAELEADAAPKPKSPLKSKKKGTSRGTKSVTK